MSLHSISSSVGLKQAARGGNRPADLASVEDALKSISRSEDGAPELDAEDEEALSNAIVAFQKRWWPNVTPDGVIHPGGRTWTKIKHLLGETSPKEFKLGRQHKLFQGDYKWQKQNLNNSKDASSNIWTKGCLLTSLAWVNDEWILIVRRTANQHHFLWVTGHDGAGNFSVWDVGYPADNENHTASVRVEDLDQIFRWGPPAKEKEAKK